MLGAEERLESLPQMVGLPAAADPYEIIRASQSRFMLLIQHAAEGDIDARREVVRLRLAYLNWAYASAGEMANPAIEC